MLDLGSMDAWALGKAFDHSVLPKNTTEEDIRKGCREAVAYNCAAFYSSSPYWTPVVLEELAGSDVLPATGIAFPFGSADVKTKVAEIEVALAAGCRALDLVINIGALKSGRVADVQEELRAFKEAAGGALTKAIIETAFLSDDEIRRASELIGEAGIDYAKTASGQFEGPSLQHFLIMKETLAGSATRLKVSGVKAPRPQNAFVFLLAGADLIGTRAVPEIIGGLDMLRGIGMVPPLRAEG